MKASPQEAARVIRKLSALRPPLALVLGSGLAQAIPELQVEVVVPYSAVPGFPSVGVKGHRGELTIGRLASQPVIVLAGRSHYYEGHPLSTVTFAVRALAAYGVRDLLLTNAAGAIHPGLRPGDFMVLKDHINFMGCNALRGAPAGNSERFVDLTRVYDPDLTRLLCRAGVVCGLKLRRGVYLAVCGPSYETPAEIRAFRTWGADAVGMSTVPEAVVARQCGLRVAAVSCITNRAAGLNDGGLSHAEVLKNMRNVQSTASKLLYCFVKLYGRNCEIGIENKPLADTLNARGSCDEV